LVSKEKMRAVEEAVLKRGVHFTKVCSVDIIEIIYNRKLG
jgi:hypothetical protein